MANDMDVTDHYEHIRTLNLIWRVVCTMTIKRIAAISAAAIMTMSITAISASAANRSRKETIEVKGL